MFSLQYVVLQVVNTVEEAVDKEGEKVVLVGHSVSARLGKGPSSSMLLTARPHLL